MRVLGIDLQPSAVSVALCESIPVRWPPRTVSDISMPVFQTRTSDPADLFNRIALRVRATIGADQMLHRIVYVGAPGVPIADPTPHLRACGLASEATQVRALSAGRALLIAAIGAIPQELHAGTSVTCIAIGDHAAEVQTFRLTEAGVTGGAVEAESAGPSYVVNQCGAAQLVEAATDDIIFRLPPGAAPADARQLISLSASELGPRLSAAAEFTDHAVVPWTGPLADALPSRMLFSIASATSWRPVQALSQGLSPTLLRDRPDLILLGGSGASWPFGRRIAEGFSTVVTIPQPNLALARGAACWKAAERVFEHLAEPRSGTIKMSERPKVDEPADLDRIAALSWRRDLA